MVSFYPKMFDFVLGRLFCPEDDNYDWVSDLSSSPVDIFEEKSTELFADLREEDPFFNYLWSFKTPFHSSSEKED
jgi:hypothetical protein